MRTLRLALAAAAAMALTACGFTGNLRMNPGYAKLSPPGRGAERELGLSLGPLPLGIARALTDDDPELSGILRALRAVRVYIYSVDPGDGRVRQRLESSRQRLIDRGWEPVLAIRDDGGFVTSLVRMHEPDVIRGLVVMIHDDEEVVLLNLIGAIEPATLALVMDELELPGPTVSIGLSR